MPPAVIRVIVRNLLLLGASPFELKHKNSSSERLRRCAAHAHTTRGLRIATAVKRLGAEKSKQTEAAFISVLSKMNDMRNVVDPNWQGTIFNYDYLRALRQ
jgi:hypothetical protein